MKSGTQLTIFTPTFNRARILPKLYQSLCSQTKKDFIWVIMDDGSDDDTGSVVEAWTKDGIISIEYCYQNNAGKHVAFNNAVDRCVTPWFMCVDSDDCLTKNAVEIICEIIQEENDNDSIIGLVGPKGNMTGETIYKHWPNEKYLKFYDLYDKGGFRGETVIVFRTNLLKNNHFPVIQGERFISENVLYRKLDQKGLYRLFDKVIYCFEYRQDGYSMNALRLVKRNPVGYMLSLKATVESSAGIVTRSKAYAYCMAVNHYLLSGESPVSITTNGTIKIMGILFYPYYAFKFIRK